jgi:hypothetical protein
MICFIDQNVPCHNDAQRNNETCLSREVYYGKLKNFFKDKDVTVALHPSNKPIEGLNCVLGRTEELVKNADLVYVHNSSAIKYAIQYKKPIEFLTFGGMGWYTHGIEKLAKKFGKIPIKIDEEEK